MLFRQSEAADSAQWTGLVPQGPYRRDDALPGTPWRRSRALTAPLHPRTPSPPGILGGGDLPAAVAHTKLH